MRRLILFNLLLFLVLSVQGQIDLNPDSLSVNASPDTTGITAAFEVTNNYSSAVSFWWKLNKDDSFPEEWKFQICDANTCYFEGVDQCPGGNPNIMQSGETNANFSIKIKPKGVEGTTLAYFTIYSDSECTNEVTTLPVMIDVGTSAAPVISMGNELTIYPNPTIDKFMLNNPKGISSIEIYNIAGKKMRTHKVTFGKEYMVDDLRNGLYLVRILDDKGKVVKVVRLSKK